MVHTTAIATWLFFERQGSESWYPAVAGLSTSEPFRDTYVRCVAAFFMCARRTNPDTPLLLFRNTDEDLVLSSGYSVSGLLTKLKVETVTLPYTFAPPADYFPSWANQFFVFDILEYFGTVRVGTDVFVILDSDCLIVSSLKCLFEAIQDEGIVAIDICYPESEIVNGLSREQMQDVFSQLAGRCIATVPKYYGGEFIATDSAHAKLLASQMRALWPILRKRFTSGLPTLYEEAQCLSYFYSEEQIPPGDGAHFARRIWTGLPPHPNTAGAEDMSIPIWHVPAEKRYGIRRLFNALIENDRYATFDKRDSGTHAFVGSFVGIPSRSRQKFALDIIDGVKFKAFGRY